MKPELTYVRSKSSDDDKCMYDCALCKQAFQFGPHRYAGQPVNAWNIMLCTGCIKDNREGIVAEMHPDLIEYLKSQGIEIRYTAAGTLRWPDVHSLRFF